MAQGERLKAMERQVKDKWQVVCGKRVFTFSPSPFAFCHSPLLFILFRMVFSVRDDKDKDSNNQYSCKYYVQSFRHLLILLLFRNCIKADEKYNYSDNKKGNARSIRDLFGQNTAYNTNSKQILGNIHEHLAGFPSSVFVFHNLIIAQMRCG